MIMLVSTMPKLWNKNKIYLSSLFQLLIWTSSGKSDYFAGKSAFNPFPTKDVYICPPRGHPATEDVYIHPHTNEITKSPVVWVGLNKWNLVVEKGLAVIIYKRPLTSYIHFAIIVFSSILFPTWWLSHGNKEWPEKHQLKFPLMGTLM